MNKRYRSAGTGEYVTEAEAKADPARTVAESVLPREGRAVARALVEAMGLPIDNCTSAWLNTPVDDVCSVTLVYNITGEQLERFGKLAKDHD